MPSPTLPACPRRRPTQLKACSTEMFAPVGGRQVSMRSECGQHQMDARCARPASLSAHAPRRAQNARSSLWLSSFHADAHPPNVLWVMTPPDSLSSLAHRASRNLDRRAGRGGNCWIWKAARHRSGYTPVRANGQVTTAARATYFLLHGRMPAGRLWRTCATRGCCNPGHAIERAPVSTPSGVKTPRRRVEAMRRARRRGRTWKAIGARFGCHYTTAARLVKGTK